MKLILHEERIECIYNDLQHPSMYTKEYWFLSILQIYREDKENTNLIRKRFWRENHSIIKYIHSNDIILFEEYAIINNENIQFNNYIIIYIINYFANSQLVKENLSFYSIYRPTSNPF